LTSLLSKMGMLWTTISSLGEIRRMWVIVLEVHTFQSYNISRYNPIKG
jgi:hypothetical protein